MNIKTSIIHIFNGVVISCTCKKQQQVYKNYNGSELIELSNKVRKSNFIKNYLVRFSLICNNKLMRYGYIYI